jgi:hypothetical protein
LIWVNPQDELVLTHSLKLPRDRWRRCRGGLLLGQEQRPLVVAGAVVVRMCPRWQVDPVSAPLALAALALAVWSFGRTSPG